MLTVTLCVYMLAVIAESTTFVDHLPQNTDLSINDSIVASQSGAQETTMSLRNGNLVLMIDDSFSLWSSELETPAGHRSVLTSHGQLLLFAESDAQIWHSHTMQAQGTNETYQLVVVAECAYIVNSKLLVSWNTDTDGCDAHPITGSCSLWRHVLYV